MIFNSLYYEKRINNNNINTQYYNGFIETFFFFERSFAAAGMVL